VFQYDITLERKGEAGKCKHDPHRHQPVSFASASQALASSSASS
jgi:hypothetical protein